MGFPLPGGCPGSDGGGGIPTIPRMGSYARSRKKKTPLPSGMVKAAAVIHESSLGIADKTPEIKQALSIALGAFLQQVEKLPRSAWENIYKDIQELLRPLGKL
jgi:hypothetical protein